MNRGIRIIEDFIEEPQQTEVSPINIYIYELPDLSHVIYDPYLADFYIKQQKINNFHGFKANYYIDQFHIYNTIKPQSKIIKIALCGNNEKAKNLLQQLIGLLLEKYNLKLEQVFLRTQNKELQDILNIDYSIPSPPVKKQLDNFFIDEEPILNYKVLIDNVWTKPMPNQPISAIKLSLNQGEIYYRTYYKGSWTKWCKNKDCGDCNSYIEGFQYELKLPKYVLQFRVHLLDSNRWTPWKNKSQCLPYKQKIDNIEFKLLKEE